MIEKIPPIEWLWNDYKKAGAWYSGRRHKLAQVSRNGSFWASKQEIKSHVPIAADIAALSANLVFSASPVIKTEHEPTQERIDKIFNRSLFSSVLRAAELCAAYGGVFVKICWDKNNDNMPSVVFVPADCGVCRWIGDRQTEITLWTIVREDDDGTVWRLEETFRPDGMIRSTLRKGDKSNLGGPVSLTAIPETAGIEPEAKSGTGRMLARYVPNMLPNHNHPWTQYGRSDFDSLYGLMDALDEAYSALQREVRLTKTSVIVPAEYLRKRDSLFNGGKRDQWAYSDESGVFTALDIDSHDTSSPITVVNPELRAADRLSVCADYVRQILSLAGYAPQSSGLDINGSAESGTALNARERKSLRTSEAKKTYWWEALLWIAQTVLAVDKSVYNTPGIDPNAEITVELPSSTQPDMAMLSDSLDKFARASAISVDQAVRMLHPEWTDEAVEDEVRRIYEEKGIIVPGGVDPLLGDMSGGEPDEPV